MNYIVEIGKLPLFPPLYCCNRIMCVLSVSALCCTHMQRSFFRNFLMYGFHILVYMLCVQGVKDTQCGFKMFTRSAAATLFRTLHINRWYGQYSSIYPFRWCLYSLRGPGYNFHAPPPGGRAWVPESRGCYVVFLIDRGYSVFITGPLTWSCCTLHSS